MWRQRLHKGFHRVVGGSLAAVALLNELKAIDLSQFLNPQRATYIVACVSMIVVALEFLPLVGKFLDGDSDSTPSDNTQASDAH